MRDRFGCQMLASHLLSAGLAIVAVVFAVWAAAVGQTFYLRLATEALIFAGLALSVELLLGFSGLLSMGQAMYFGLGAYVSALTLMRTESFVVAIGAAAAASFVVAIIGGLIVNRVRGVYFVLITFAMAQVASKVVYNTKSLGASDGLIGIPVAKIVLPGLTLDLSDPATLFLVTALVIACLYGFCAWLLNTPMGRVLVALRSNERRVPFLGYSVWSARMAAYVIAGMVAGVAGAMYPMLRGFVSPELMFFSTSGNAVIMVLLGGAGTLAGALYGAGGLVLLKSVVGTYTEHHLIVIGLLFIGVVLLVPQGFVGYVRPAMERWLAARASRQRVYQRAASAAARPGRRAQ